jgi:PhoH-like ATPase
MQKEKKLIVVLDTSVLLYDKKSIESFENCEIYIPMIVLDELDRFKEAPGLLGENSRHTNRYLDGLRSSGKLSDGVKIQQSSTLRVHLLQGSGALSQHFDFNGGDNRLLLHALQIKSEHPEHVVRIVTKDINLRVKADALGFEAEDYYKDYLNDDMWSGVADVILEDSLIDEIYRNKQISDVDFPEIEETFKSFTHNTFVVAKSSSQTKKSTLCRWNSSEKRVQLIEDCSVEGLKIKPRNKEQKFALWGLTSEDVKLMTVTGLAGSGKTFIALMAALAQIEAGRYDRLVITRNVEPVGRDMGFLPGTIEEKMEPWLAPIMDNMRTHFKNPLKFEEMKENGRIEIAPLAYIRGRTFTNSFVLVDESQNASIHELKTIITRIGDGSKIVLIGDTDQIDTPYINKQTNGLSIVAKKMRASKLTAHINLPNGVRSSLATEAGKIL